MLLYSSIGSYIRIPFKQTCYEKINHLINRVAFQFGNFNSLATLTPSYATPYQQKPATHLKKDGTPDKRFKENKPAKGPLKKDGTPDMRYKANKKAGGSK